MSNTDNINQKKLGVFSYVIGGISFIPLLGFLFGLVAVIWGLLTKKQGGKRLASIATLGISFNFVLYGALFYITFVQRGGVADDQRLELAKIVINELVPSIEFYRIQHGRYPESLKVLKEEFLREESIVLIFDPSFVELGKPLRYFFYKRVGEDHYYLRGLGIDGKPFTNDDVLPQVTSTSDSKIGLLLKRRIGHNLTHAC